MLLPKVGMVDVFARHGEQDLFDHVADLRERVCVRRVPGGVECVRE